TVLARCATAARQFPARRQHITAPKGLRLKSLNSKEPGNARLFAFLLLLSIASAPAQEIVERGGTGRGRTARRMDAPIEPTGTYLRRVLPRLVPPRPAAVLMRRSARF
ncbi:hypothetical protein C7E24_09700, partial [Stenotrophomonas maltophilia]